jgi:hypothetical protein
VASATSPTRGDSSDLSSDTTLSRFLKGLAKAERLHEDRVRHYKDADDAYDAVLKPKEALDETDWRSTLCQPLVFEVVQTIKALLMDDRPQANVSPPKGKPESKDKAQAYENVINDQRVDDDYEAKLDEFILQGLQRGLTVAKNAWEVRTAKVRTQSVTPVYGSVLPTREIGEPEEQTVTNRPTFIVCDVNDVMWDDAATTANTITDVYWRTYETKASLRALEDDGVYQNTKDIGPAQTGPTGRPGGRNVRDLIEVIERWSKTADGITLTTVANRNTLIRDEEPSPFIHQELPFVFCAPTPRLKHVVGKSEPEIIADLQREYWLLQNQSLDNIALINNTVMFPPDSEDTTDWEIRPGAINPKQNPNPIEFWNPPTSILEPADKAMQRVKGDMQDISAASPYVSGADSQGIDNKTATGISLVQNMATKRILLKKQRFADAERAIGRQQLQLNEQLAPDLLPAYGPGGEPMPLRILDIIGCTYEVEDAAESLNRQERRQEATLMLQTIASLMALPQFAMVINARQFLENYIEAFDDDPESLLMPAMAPMAPQLGAPPGVGPASPVPPQGSPPGAMPTTPQFGAGAPGVLPFAPRLPGGQVA